MDFITDLPLSDGCDQLCVVIDRYTKMSHFIPLKKNSKKAPDLGVIFAKEILRFHGLPSNIISDRDSRFTSVFWESHVSSLGIRPRMSTAFHPQTDRQTERLNQTIDAFLRAYVNFQQNDWVELLSLAEFAYNNTITTAHSMTPFYANYGYHPSSGSALPGSNTLPVHSITYGHWMKAI
jgi:transposase InsO family protein